MFTPPAHHVEMQRQQQLAREGEKPAGICNLFVIPGPVQRAIVVQTYPLWKNYVIPESIGICRPWTSDTAYVHFDLDSPLFASSKNPTTRSSTYGRDAAYPGYAIPAKDAVDIGLLSQTAYAKYIEGSPGVEGARQVPLTAEFIKQESANKAAHDAFMRSEKQKDEDRLGPDVLLNDLGEQWGKVTGSIISAVGKVLGNGAAAFLTGLGPVGSSVIILVAGYGVFRMTR